MAYIEIYEDCIIDGEYHICIEDYLDEVDTVELVDELRKRRNLPKRIKTAFLYLDDTERSKTPIRDFIVMCLDLHTSATIEDIQEKIKEIYFK